MGGAGVKAAPQTQLAVTNTADIWNTAGLRGGRRKDTCVWERERLRGQRGRWETHERERVKEEALGLLTVLWYVRHVFTPGDSQTASFHFSVWPLPPAVIMLLSLDPIWDQSQQRWNNMRWIQRLETQEDRNHILWIRIDKKTEVKNCSRHYVKIFGQKYVSDCKDSVFGISPPHPPVSRHSLKIFFSSCASQNVSIKFSISAFSALMDSKLVSSYQQFSVFS